MNKISWHAPEYIHKHKTADWYWIVGIVTVSIAIISIILNDVIFSILIIVSAITLSLYATRPPKILDIELTATGVRIGGSYYPYSDLNSFWVETRTAYPKIIFQSKKKISLFITALIDTEDVDPEVVEAFLSEHMEQVEHTEPLLEKLLIYLGF